MPETIKEWVRIVDGEPKFIREHLLNHAINNWNLNQAYSVGPTSELIRACGPKSLEEWEKFYFQNAVQKKKNGIRITREYIEDIGRKIYVKLSEVVHKELESISEDECIDYAFNLVINRTYQGYVREIDTVYGQLENALRITIDPASDRLDRVYNVDFTINVNGTLIGLQIKPVGNVYNIPQIFKEKSFQLSAHKKFTEKFGGKVFYVYSKKKIIQEKDILINQILEEVTILRKTKSQE